MSDVPVTVAVPFFVRFSHPLLDVLSFQLLFPLPILFVLRDIVSSILLLPICDLLSSVRPVHIPPGFLLVVFGEYHVSLRGASLTLSTIILRISESLCRPDTFLLGDS
jgi:hypothetical protein